MPRTAGRRKRIVLFLAIGLLLSLASVLPVLWIRTFQVHAFRAPAPPASAFGQIHAERAGIRIYSLNTAMGPPDSFSRDTSLDQWWMRTPKNPGRVWLSLEVAAGWPLPLLSGGFTTVIDSQGNPAGQPWGIPMTSETMFVTVPGSTNAQRLGFSEYETAMIFPTRPIVRGLIADTLFYAALVWSLFALVGITRRAVRRRRGLCEWCAYSLVGLDDAPRCPECGNDIRRARPSPSDAVAL